ncbi:hypothetical protein HY224_03170 [Candidatus Uhrbacteria bacterium]|nr:hypothetical protein [Candidatus Uhrbacteria bacterium]
MVPYKTKCEKVSGTDYKEVRRKISRFYNVVKRKTRRRPYVRSAYFNGEKIFLESFWQHLYAKENFRDKVRRMKYFPCALELIEKSRLEPDSKENPNNHSVILHRFGGITKGGELFFVQIREEKRSGEKWLMSVFPV